MFGTKSGVATRLSAGPRAVFTHCYGNSLNLACVHTTRGITKFIKRTPARYPVFKQLNEDLASDSERPGIRVLSATRWTARNDALKSILDNFNVLLELRTESLETVKDTEMKARIQGDAPQMMKFDYLFGISLGLMIQRNTDNLNIMMQKAYMSAGEGQVLTLDILSVVISIYFTHSFNSFS